MTVEHHFDTLDQGVVRETLDRSDEGVGAGRQAKDHRPHHGIVGATDGERVRVALEQGRANERQGFRPRRVTRGTRHEG
jgi:hypothetical protein